jgi:endonuclease V-like protein UPF0215 family
MITIMRMDGYIEGFLSAWVSTDGLDSSRVISDTLAGSRFAGQVRAVLSDGACLAGFNVLDLADLNERMDIPIITCSDEEPDTESVVKALRANFYDWKERASLITRWEPKKIDLPDGPCFIRAEGITSEKAEWIVRKMTRRGRTPEPLRISHMAAGAIP